MTSAPGQREPAELRGERGDLPHRSVSEECFLEISPPSSFRLRILLCTDAPVNSCLRTERESEIEQITKPNPAPSQRLSV
ncbi:hypothetical protein SRHO_G00240370 [Serrasalmus rhombeus]